LLLKRKTNIYSCIGIKTKISVTDRPWSCCYMLWIF